MSPLYFSRAAVCVLLLFLYILAENIFHLILIGLIVLCICVLDLAGLPLVKFDFSCNKVSTIPVCYRKMSHLQSLQLENNPLQSPPAQVTHIHSHNVFFSSLTTASDIIFAAFRYAWKARFIYLSTSPWRHVVVTRLPMPCTFLLQTASAWHDPPMGGQSSWL